MIPCAVSVRWSIKQTTINHISSNEMNHCIIYRLYRHWRQRLQLQKENESLCQTESFQDRGWQLCLCITAANSHFHSRDDTLTFSTLDVLTAVQVTAQVRWRVRQAAHYIGLMKELTNALLRWATVLQSWQQVKRQRMSRWWVWLMNSFDFVDELVYASNYCWFNTTALLVWQYSSKAV